MTRQTTFRLVILRTSQAFLGSMGAPDTIVLTKEGGTIFHQLLRYLWAFPYCVCKRRFVAGRDRGLTSHRESIT